MVSLLAGLLSIGPGVFLFGRVVKMGAGSRLSVAVGTALILLIFVAVTSAIARITLRLEAKS